jgi:hypothetical protein
LSSYTIHSEAGLVLVALTGRLSYETIAAMLVELDALTTARLPDKVNVLIDETDASAGLLNVAEIRKWIARWRQATALKEGRIAVVAPSIVMYGLNRMAHAIAGAESEGHLEVFRDRGEALIWLQGESAAGR